MNPRLLILSGPNAGTEVPLDASPFWIGRKSNVNLALDDDGMVSRQHCAIRLNNGTYEVQDNQSRNGTWLNGKQIGWNQWTPLNHNGRLRTGNTLLGFVTGPFNKDDFPLHDADTLDFTGETDRSPAEIATRLTELRELLELKRPVEWLSQTIISSIHTLIRVKHAAIVLLDGEIQDLTIDRSFIDSVIKDGPKSTRTPRLTVHCVQLCDLGTCFGVIYVESETRHLAREEDDLRLLQTVAAISGPSLHRTVRRERAQSVEPDQFVGTSAAMRPVLELIGTAAGSNVTVLIQGESGTGKEVVARTIQQNSARAKGPFVKVNCAAFSESLLESELFGHEKGAFTGAVEQRKGKFEAANGGTIFLDEIGDLSSAAQVKLLRVIQEREFERVGGNRTIPVDVRIIAATNRDLQADVSEGRFRKDLYFRLKVLPIFVPPLRDRKDDIPALAMHFTDKFARELKPSVRGVHADAMNILANYHWPGNVRELQNVIERGVALSATDAIFPGDLLFEQFETSEIPSSFRDTLKATKREQLQQALNQTGGDAKKTAEMLGMHVTYVYRLVDNLGLGHLLKSRR